MARKRATLTDLLNNLTYATVYNKFKLLATSAFEWEGLPEGIDEKHIERFLFTHGKAIFFRDPEMDFMCLEAHDSGELNVYGEPLFYIATGFKYHKRYASDKCVIIENNNARQCTHDFVMFYTNKLYEAERTMDVNVKTNKAPFIFACDEKNLLTVKRMFQQIEENQAAIYTDKALDIDSVTVLQTGVKFLCNDLMDYKKSVENELLTFLGFNNLAVDKKERVNLSEANSNNQITQSFAELQLQAREKACKRINDMFGLNVSVKRRQVAPVERGVENVDNSDV